MNARFSLARATTAALLVAVVTLLGNSASKRRSARHLRNEAPSHRWLSALSAFHDPKSMVPRPEEERGLTCLELRGQSGSWVRRKGFKYKEIGTYINNGSGCTSCRDKSKTPTIESWAKWKWVDNVPHCQMHELSREGFCNIMELFGYRRIFFVGDSLSFMMANSFWWLMEEAGDFGTKLGYGFNHKYIQCAVGREGEEPYIFELAMARNDNLSELGTDDHHEDWVGHYLQNDDRTILIANTGAHVQREDYEYDMNQFVESVQRLDRPQDLTIYRTSSPGHKGCSSRQKPLNSFQEYHDMEYDQIYNYMHMTDFNQYSKERVLDLAAGGGNWMMLDIFPMTILRPDGHKRPPDDCLHYKYPGPQDTWNHLLFSNFLNLAVEMQSQALLTGSDPISHLKTPLCDELSRHRQRAGNSL